MKLLTKLYSTFWTHYLRWKGAKVGNNFVVERPINLLLRDEANLSNLIIGDNVTFTGKVYIRMRRNGRIKLDRGVRIGTEVWLVTANEAELTVGENTILNNYSIFNGGHGLSIGAHCIFAAFVYINTSDHNFKKGELIQKQGFFGAPIIIGNDVWLGGQVFISKNVKIGDGAVIGAGTVVIKDVPPYHIVAGNPARVIKERV